MKPTIISDPDGRLLWCGATRPGRMHDVTAIRTEGIADLLRQYPKVKAKVDAGYQGLARDFPDQVSAPPKKPPKDADDTQRAAYNTARHAQSSQRICVKHTIAEPKQWRPLQHYVGRREHFEHAMLAIAGSVSDRCAEG
jgi:DDE superfamily endonuclease